MALVDFAKRFQEVDQMDHLAAFKDAMWLQPIWCIRCILCLLDAIRAESFFVIFWGAGWPGIHNGMATTTHSRLSLMENQLS